MKYLIPFILMISGLKAQEDTTTIDFSAYVKLDSIMITAKKQGFSVPEFIKIIQNDNSLEVSFNALRKESYKYSNDITYYSRKKRVADYYKSINVQHYTGECQWMEVLEEERIGNYEKYYTTDFYKRVFYKPLKSCDAEKREGKKSRTAKVLEKRINELKKLIYTPGTEASIPLIGNKTAIFSEKMIQYYDFSITSSGESYKFIASIKPGFNVDYPNGSVVKFLEIEMDKDTDQVLSRNYKLQYHAGVYSFDVLMLIQLKQHDGTYVPSEITYDGYWKVAGRKKEKCKFHFKILEFID